VQVFIKTEEDDEKELPPSLLILILKKIQIRCCDQWQQVSWLPSLYRVLKVSCRDI